MDDPIPGESYVVVDSGGDWWLWTERWQHWRCFYPASGWYGSGYPPNVDVDADDGTGMRRPCYGASTEANSFEGGINAIRLDFGINGRHMLDRSSPDSIIRFLTSAGSFHERSSPF